MLVRFLIRLKICRLSSKIRSMETMLINIRYDAYLKNNIYYAGRGDVDSYLSDVCYNIYFKIAACQRLLDRYQKKLDGVVGENS